MRELNKILEKQIENDILKRRYAKISDVLKLVGAGIFLASSIVVPNLPRILNPFFKDGEKEAWKRFNIPYLKRSLYRLEKQRLVEFCKEGDEQIVKITDRGRKKLFKSSLELLSLEKPLVWDGSWWMVTYDIPKNFQGKVNIFREYMKVWNFYPFQKSVYLHAYPCESQITFLREYLGIGSYVRLIKISAIENDRVYRDFFGI